MFQRGPERPLNQLRISSECAACSLAREHPYWNLLSIMAPRAIWGVMGSMVCLPDEPNDRSSRTEHISDDLKPENQPLSNRVTSGERCKLLTNDQLLIGPSDSDWHHPLLVNIDVMHENSNISEAALKRKREKERERGYSS